MKVIGSVKPNVRTWSGSYGPMESVDGTFQDGDGWTINCKPGNGEKTKAELSALIGKPLDGYAVEAKMKDGKQQEYQGKLQWTLKKQQAQGGYAGRGGGGGGKTWSESYAQSKECKQIEQRSIQRSVALQQAVQLAVAGKIGLTPGIVLDYADQFDAWLSKASAPPEPEKSPADLMADFMAALKATNAERKSKGKGPADSTAVAEALNLRGWTVEGFRSWTELQDALGSDKFRRLTKAMDLNPCNFERETHREEDA